MADVSNRRRDPIGRFDNENHNTKPSMGLSLGGGEQRFDWRDPEFQHLTGPVPMLDGAIIEYDDGHRARIGVIDNGSYSIAQIHNPETGERLPSYIPSDPYRVVSCDAGEERIHDEFKAVHLRLKAIENDDACRRQYDQMGEQFFDERDVYTWNNGNIRSDGVYNLPYSNEDGSKQGWFYVDSRNRTVTMQRGSDTGSRRYKRLSKFVGSKEFIDEVGKMDDIEKERCEIAWEARQHDREIEEKYGRRY